MNNELENNPQEETGIGDLLRTEREKKGISKRRLAEDIRVREHIIEALENEEWDKLPARVFIKGFIRSYTISIGYDTAKALKLFDASSPPGGEDVPKPLTRKKKRNLGIYYIVLFLIILAALVYFFKVKDRDEDSLEGVQSVSGSLSYPVDKAEENEDPPEPVKPPEGGSVAETQEQPVPKMAPPENKESVQEEPADIPEVLPERDEKNPLTEETIPGETGIKKDIPEPETVTGEPAEFLNQLSATVNMRTYVKIIVDDNPPKEFIFQPGSNPWWTSVRGFEVTVGNAGGIEFEFNGEMIKNIGGVGKVKKLRFPDDFKTEWEE